MLFTYINSDKLLSRSHNSKLNFFPKIMFKKSVFGVLSLAIFISLKLSDLYVQKEFEGIEDLVIRLGIASFRVGTFLVR